MPKSKKPNRKPTSKVPGPSQPQKVLRPGADAARIVSQRVKPIPLPGKSRGR